jgi:hypothetical protein
MGLNWLDGSRDRFGGGNSRLNDNACIVDHRRGDCADDLGAGCGSGADDSTHIGDCLARHLSDSLCRASAPEHNARSDTDGGSDCQFVVGNERLGFLEHGELLFVVEEREREESDWVADDLDFVNHFVDLLGESEDNDKCVVGYYSVVVEGNNVFFNDELVHLQDHLLVDGARLKALFDLRLQTAQVCLNLTLGGVGETPVAVSSDNGARNSSSGVSDGFRIHDETPI